MRLSHSKFSAQKSVGSCIEFTVAFSFYT